MLAHAASAVAGSVESVRAAASSAQQLAISSKAHSCRSCASYGGGLHSPCQPVVEQQGVPPDSLQQPMSSRCWACAGGLRNQAARAWPLRGVGVFPKGLVATVGVAGLVVSPAHLSATQGFAALQLHLYLGLAC